MTGQGQGRVHYGSAEISAEVRAVNNRHLKVQTRTGEGLGGLEPRFESLVRSKLRRGSLQLNVQMAGGAPAGEYLLQEEVLESYVVQCQQISKKLQVESGVSIGNLLGLPGVVVEPKSMPDVSSIDAELVERALEAVEGALTSLNEMRRTEGASMESELSRQINRLDELTKTIEQRAPQVIEDYRTRLTSRLSIALADVTTDSDTADFAREVLIMADKADIREEIVRLRSHFTQFRQLLGDTQSQGRKLDFLIQEIFRETNTIGSKANDADIAQRVVDMKTIVEQMRELVQNVE